MRLFGILLVISTISLCSGCTTLFGDGTYDDLKHCKVPKEWVQIRNDAWTKASAKLSQKGYKPITECRKIIIQKGIKINPKSGQWGRSMNYAGKEFWYAGLSSSKYIYVVGTPEGKPYSRASAIMTHEAAESILTSNNEKRTTDERNEFLWKLGL